MRRSASKIAKRLRPTGLGAIHRDVSLVNQPVGRLLAILGNREADTRRDVHRPAADLERLAESLQHAPATATASKSFSSSSSMIANSSPPRRPTRSPTRTASRSAVRRLGEQAVACLVADAVVDLLERVDVDEQHTEVQAGEPVARDRAGQLVAEHLAIRQRCQRVTRDSVLEPEPLRHILGGGVPVLAVRAAAPQQRAPASVAVTVAGEQFDEAARPAVGGVRLARSRGGVVRMQVVEQALADQLAGGTAEHSGAGVVDRDEARLSVEDREHAAGVVEELLEGLQAEIAACPDRCRERHPELSVISLSVKSSGRAAGGRGRRRSTRALAHRHKRDRT